MRVPMTAVLANVILAFCARAAPSSFQGTNGTFYSNTSIVFNKTAPVHKSSPSYTNTTSVFCKRDGSTCTTTSFTPSITVPGNFSSSPSSSIPDIDYFRFSSSNIALSQSNEWYSSWSVLRQTDPEYTELGEWKLFAKDFAQTYNFECDLTFGSCVNYPSLGDLQRMWPGEGNRALVRRVFFTFHRFKLAHDYVRAVDEAYDRTHTYVIGMVPEIITTFSLQVDAAKKMKCDQIHTFVNMMVNIGIQLAQLVLMGFLGPELIPLSVEARVAMAELPALQTALKTAVEESVIQSTQTRIDALKKILDKALSDKGKLSWMTTYGPLDQRVKDTGNARNFAWSNVLLYNFAFYEMAAYTDLKKVYNFKNMAIGPGISHGTICTGFEGDFVDNNAGNRDNLAARLSSVFESGRKQRQALFKALYRGFVTNAGEQSGTAMWLTTRNWEGPSSVLEDMRDISKMEEDIKTAVVKSLITDTLTTDFNYIKCGYREDAASHCQKASTATKGKDLSVFCPHADTDPQFMCDSRRWYFSDINQHDIPMVAAKKFETFAGNRFGLTRQQFLLESFYNYERYTYSNPTDYGAWGYGNSSSQGIGFNLPVCVMDQPRFFEKSGFPSMCGNWHASETESFLEAMNAGPNSTIYTYRKDSMPMYLHSDIIPQALDAFPPLTRYLGLCANSIRFPVAGERTGVRPNRIMMQLSKDKDCELIQNGTKDTTDEEDANRWFCTNVGGHTVFEREWGWSDTNSIKTLQNHKTRCREWLTKHGVARKDGDRPGT